MFRKFVTGGIMIGVVSLPLVARAAIFSPTLTDLLDVAHADFVQEDSSLGAPFFPDSSALHSVVDNLNGTATYTFSTGYDVYQDMPDGEFPETTPFWRTAMEFQNTALGWPIDISSGIDAFQIQIGNPVPMPSGINIAAQIYVRSAGGTVFTSSNNQQLNNIAPTTFSIPISTIINQGGDPSDITSFGIELFGGDEFLGGLDHATVTVQTAPQPPTLVDNLLYSWETADNVGTPGVNEALEGWATQQGAYTPGTVPHPDHTHSVVQNTMALAPATEGTHALKVVRDFTGQALPGTADVVSFRWGSQLNLDANAGGGGPLLGDYNGNDEIDAADYTVWRDAMTAGSTTLTNDPTPGTVNESDFTYWRNNFGTEGGGGPDAGVLAEIGEIVDLINDPNAYSVSFDITFVDQFPDPNPAYANFFLSIAADDGDPESSDRWFQGPQVDVDLAALGNGPVQFTLDFLLSQMDDANQSGQNMLSALGIFPDTQYLTFNVASNLCPTADNCPVGSAPGEYAFYIDNFRIRTIVPEVGAGSGFAAIPEPATMLMGMLGLACGASLIRKKVR